MSDDSLSRILDRLEIRDLLTRYGRAIHQLDADELREVFHGDARVDKGPGLVSIDDYVPDIITRHTPNPHASLQVTNVLIDFVDADSAFVESWAIETAQLPEADRPGWRDCMYWVRYGDLVERRGDGSWRIAERRLVLDHVLTWPGTSPEADGALRDRFVGRRNPAQDPIARLRREVALRSKE